MTDITIKAGAATPLCALLRIFHDHGDQVATDGAGGILVGPGRARSKDASDPEVLDMCGMFRPQASIVGEGPGAA